LEGSTKHLLYMVVDCEVDHPPLHFQYIVLST